MWLLARVLESATLARAPAGSSERHNTQACAASGGLRVRLAHGKKKMNADYGQWIEVSDASRPPNPTGTGSIPRRKRSAPGAGRPSLEQGAPPAGCPRPGSTRGPAHGVATGAPRGEAGSPGVGPAPGLPAEQGCLGGAPSPAPRESGKNWAGCPQRWAPKRGSSGRERGASGVWRQSAGRTTRRGNRGASRVGCGSSPRQPQSDPLHLRKLPGNEHGRATALVQPALQVQEEKNNLCPIR